MDDGFLTSALAAAVRVGAAAGLPTGAPEVLARKSNVLVRLGPAVARVPATTRLIRPDAQRWLAHDVALSAFLTERGVRVVQPWENPGPHVANGLPVTLWRFTRHDPGRVAEPAETGRMLGELHEALAEFDGDLSGSGPVRDLQAMVSYTDDDRLRDEVARVADAASALHLPVQALHGDAHRGNLLYTEDGPMWLDFEDSWRGPVAWDLACLVLSDSPRALEDYPGPRDGLAEYIRLRRLMGVCWMFVVAHRFPARRPEAVALRDAYFG